MGRWWFGSIIIILIKQIVLLQFRKRLITCDNERQFEGIFRFISKWKIVSLVNLWEKNNNWSKQHEITLFSGSETHSIKTSDPWTNNYIILRTFASTTHIIWKSQNLICCIHSKTGGVGESIYQCSRQITILFATSLNFSYFFYHYMALLNYFDQQQLQNKIQQFTKSVGPSFCFCFKLSDLIIYWVVKMSARASAADTPIGRIVAETFSALFESAHGGGHGGLEPGRRLWNYRTSW